MNFENKRTLKHFFLIVITSSLLILFFSNKVYCSSLDTDIELNFEEKKTNNIDGEEIIRTEYRPKLSINYNNKITEYTDLSSKIKMDYKNEKSSEEGEDNEKFEPSIDLGLKSKNYNLNAGTRQTWEKDETDPDKTVNSFSFAETIVQIKNLPDLRLKYSHTEKDDPNDTTDKIELESRYNLFQKIELIGKYYLNKLDEGDEKRVTANVKTNHTFFPRQTLKIGAGYKIESLYNETSDTTNTKDINQLINAKASYRPASKTQVNLRYETEILNNQSNKLQNDDKISTQIDFDINQKIWDFAQVRGQINKETEHRADPNIEDNSTKKLIYLGELAAAPNRLLDLDLKFIKETKDDPNNIEKNIYEQSLRSYFDNLFNSKQTLNHRTLDEKDDRGDISREQIFKWSWQAEPIRNLNVEPMYIYSDIKDYNTSEDRTHEYKIDFGYKLNLLEKTQFDMSYSWDYKKKKSESDPNASDKYTIAYTKEYNTDTTFDISSQPFENLYINAGVNIEKRDERGEEPDTYIITKDTTYSFKSDWNLNPYNISCSYQYNNREALDDTESFELKIDYKFINYLIEGKYKFTNTFSSDSETTNDSDEQSIYFKFKAKF